MLIQLIYIYKIYVYKLRLYYFGILVIKTCMYRVKVKIIQKYTVLMKWVKGVV